MKIEMSNSFSIASSQILKFSILQYFLKIFFALLFERPLIFLWQISPLVLGILSIIISSNASSGRYQTTIGSPAT